MPNDRDKLLKIMDSLEVDYQSGKISPEKYSYFRSKYEDKLNSIDAKEATQRIRSMQGKSNYTTQKERSRKPANNKKEKEQDLVQKYIINPKRGDAKYDKKEKKSMSSGTFKLVLLLVLVIAFTVGVGYGVFNLDFNNISETTTVAIVQDTAFPDITENIKNTTKTTSSRDYTNYSSTSYDVETTDDSSNDYGQPDSGSGSSSGYSNGGSGSSSGSSSSGSGSNGGSSSGSSSESSGSEE